MNKYLILLSLFVISCKSNKERQTLHNYPYFENMECPQSFALENENILKAEAKALNMRYVDYLHIVTTLKGSNYVKFVSQQKQKQLKIK